MHPPYQYFDHGSRQKLALHPILSDRCSLAPKAHRNLAARLLTQWILTRGGRSSQEKSENSEPKKWGGPPSPGSFGRKNMEKPGSSDPDGQSHLPPPWAELLRCHHSPLRASPIPNCRTCRQSHATWGRSSSQYPKWVLKGGITGRTPSYCQFALGRSSSTSGWPYF